MTIERGSMLPLAAALLAVCGLVALGIADSTDLALARTRLQSTADAAALVCAESFDPLLAGFDGTAVNPRLTPRDIRRSARGFLRDTHSEARLVSGTTPDGRTARVVLRSDWSPPIVSEFFPVRLLLTATASARSVLR